jgi:hypothetical protein
VEPALFQVDKRPEHFAFSDNYAPIGPPFNGICQTCHTNTSLKWHSSGSTETYPHDHHKSGVIPDNPNCLACHSHAAGFPRPTCFSCHSAAQDNGDNLPVGGRRAVWGEFTNPGNSHHTVTAIDNDGTDCQVCHEDRPGSPYHMDGYVDLLNADSGTLITESTSGGFQKANLIETDINSLNTFCQSCHDSDGANGNLDPFGDGSAGPPEKSLHSNVNFASDRVEGEFTVGCIQCHEGHGSTNIKIIDDTSVLVNNSTGLASAGTTSGPVEFDQATGVNSGDELYESLSPDVLDTSDIDDLCVTCHITSPNAMVNHADGDHTGSAQGTDEIDNNCMSCHPHGSSITEQKGFMPPAGGAATCDTCHATGGTGVGGANNRRAIFGAGGDFNSGDMTSYHANDGDGSETVTKWDCAVCHAEVDADTTTVDGTYHDNGKVELRHADGTDNSYTNADGVYGDGTNGIDWASLTPAERSDFCLSCHDGDGATIIAGRTDPDPDATTDPLNPFNDGVTNSHEGDGFDGTTAPHSRIRPANQTGAGSPGVVDIASRFDTLNAAHHAVLGQAYTSGDISTWANPGVLGAIQGVRTDLDWTSTLNCEDCHYGGATTKLNGHGTANSRYLLRNASGSDAIGDFASKTLICHRCHDPHVNATNFPAHMGQDGNHQTDDDNIYGIACMNCHGGGFPEEYLDRGTPTTFVTGGIPWGAIHGVSDTEASITGVTPNLFHYGAALGNTTNWTSLGSPSCGAIEAVTVMNNCTNHNGKGTSDAKSYTRTHDRTYPYP